MGLPAWHPTQDAGRTREKLVNHQILYKEIHACISKVKPPDKRKNQVQTQTKCDDSLNMAVAYRLRCNEYRIMKPITFYAKGG